MKSTSTPSLVFLSGKRTPFGKNGGSLASVGPTELSHVAAQAALQQSGLPAQAIQHVIWGNVLITGGESIYTPRHTGLKCGVPQEVPALGVNRLCGSGFQVIVEAYQQMLSGDSQTALVGGVENMSMAPYILRNARWGMRMGNQAVEDLLMTGLTDPLPNLPMAMTAENLAVKYQISRQQCDVFAVESQRRTKKAKDEGFFKYEITPIEVQVRKDKILLQDDEHPRADATLEALSQLKALFKKDGTVTAGNASGIVDGAAAMVVASESYAQDHGLRPLGRMVSYGIVGCDPSIMGIGPVKASQQALERAGKKLQDMDLVEVNEAFAPQALAVAKEMGIDPQRFNVNGGAIAIGHPLGASGTRITMSALYELQRRKKKYALVSACIGGGQGIALVIEAFV